MTGAPHIILTVDYELFGDGSGCLDACVLKPAAQMMQIAERFNAPVTFFAEALEFIAMTEQKDDSRAKSQLNASLKRGHDVQLHIHPQWHDASFDFQESWLLDMDSWRMGDLTKLEVDTLLGKAKQWLEGEVASNIPNYRCVAFRAGGWCIQPSEVVISALIEKGFVLDSTVASGQWRIGYGEWSDFRNAPDLPFWLIQDDVCRPSSNGLWEVPISVGNINPLQHLKALFISNRGGAQGLAPNCTGSYRGPSENRWHCLRAKMARLQQLGKVMLDISTLPADVLIEVTRQWRERYSKTNRRPLPIVAIAHTKNFTPVSEQSLVHYFKWAQNEGMVFSTYGGWLESLAKQ